MDKLDRISEELAKLYGHLAIAQEERAAIRLIAWREGRDAGYKLGYGDGLKEGFEEGKVFPNTQATAKETEWIGG